MCRKAAAILALLVFSPPLWAAETNSALARLAASMKPGTWAVLNKDGDESGYGLKFTESGIGTMYGYASKATYDPVRRRVFFFASGQAARERSDRQDRAGAQWVIACVRKEIGRASCRRS